jgi:hypothetical protein
LSSVFQVSVTATGLMATPIDCICKDCSYNDYR